jgi:uncharacterized membrane protein
MFLISLFKTYKDVKGVHDDAGEGLGDLSFDFIRPFFTLVSLALLGVLVILIILYSAFGGNGLLIASFVVVGILSLVRIVAELARRVMTRMTKKIVEVAKNNS